MKENMKFFGSVTVGERGQIVVPAEARQELEINPGDKLLVFKTPFGGGVALLKPGEFERHMSRMNERAAEMKKQLSLEEGEANHEEN